MTSYYVGLDGHLKHTSVCTLDGDGKRFKRLTIRGPWRKIAEELKRLPGKVAVCFEASTAYGCLHELFSEGSARVVVAHPGQLRLIFRSKKKNDRADAEKLAKLLFLGEVPTVYVPSQDVRAWRQLVEYRRRLIAKRTRTKNALRAFHERIQQGNPERKKTALVATAHYLVRVMYAMLRDNRAW